MDALDDYGKIQSAHIIAVLPLTETVTDTAAGAKDLSELTGPKAEVLAASAPESADPSGHPAGATAVEATPENPLQDVDDLSGAVVRVKWTMDAWGESSDRWVTNVSPRLFLAGLKAGAGKKSFGMGASDKHSLSNVARPCMPDSTACMDYLDPAWATGGDCVVFRGRGGGGPLHLQVVRAFTNGGSLESYMQRMEAPAKSEPGSAEHKAALADLPTPKTVRHVLLSLVHSLHVLNREFVQQLAPRLLKCFVGAVSSWPDVMLREFNSEVFVTCGNCLRFLFLRVFDSGFALSQMEEASLSVARSLLHGNLITLRILGMRVMQEACNGVRLNQTQSTSADVLVPIVNEDVLPPLYDPRSAFSDLVRRSADVLRMMARADALTEDTLRRLWALKFADAVSSDTKLQVYQVLEAVSADMSAEQLSFVLCEFLGKLPRSAATVADVQLAYKVGCSSKHQTQVGHIAMQVLWRLLDDGLTGVDPALAPARELRPSPIMELDGLDDDVPAADASNTEQTPAVDPVDVDICLTPPRLEKGSDAADTSEVSAEVQDSAGVHLARLTKLFTMKPCKKPYLLLAVAAVQRGANVSRFLQLVWDLVDSYNLTAIAADPETKATAVAELNAEVNLMDVFFKNLGEFKASAKQQLAALTEPVTDVDAEKERQEAVNAAALRSEGGITFAVALRTRMDFLTSVTRVSSLTVSEAQATTLWDMFVVDAMTTSETERVMRFLINAASMSASGLGEVLSKEVELYLFLNKMASADLPLNRFSLPVFSAFRLYFLLANARRGWLSRTPGGGHTDFIVHIDPDNMLGTDALWRVALEAPDNDAAEAAMAFLMSLYGQLSPTFDMDTIVSSIDFAGEISLPAAGRPPASDVRSKFIKGCMMHLRQSLGEMSASPAKQSESSLAIASRCLSALSRLMTEADVYGDAGLRPHSARLAGERLKIKFSNSVPAVYCSDDAPKNMNLMFYSNSSVWQVREAVGSKLGLKPQRVKLVRGGSELMPADNAKTLREVKVNSSGNVLVTYKSPAAPKQAPLLMDSTISYNRWAEAKYSPAAEAAFAEMFSRFSFDGFMTPAQFRMYLVACGVGGSNVALARIQNIFKRSDTTPAGDMTQQGFLEFYKEASVSRAESVRKDLRQHGYDTRTLQLTDKEKAAAIGQMMRDARDKALAEASSSAAESPEGDSKEGKEGEGKKTSSADEILLQKVADVYSVDLSKDDSRKNADETERKRLLDEAEALEAEAQKNNPRLLMTSNMDFFHLLFDALAAPSSVAAPAWDLLQRLPTNADMVASFAQVPAADSTVDWAQLLDSRTPFKLLYALQVVESFMQAPDIGSLENINRAEEVENKATIMVREKAAREREEAAASGGEILSADQKAAQKVVEDDEDAQRAAKYTALRQEFAERKAEADARSTWRAAFVNKAGLQYLHTLLHSFEVPAGAGADVEDEDVEATLAREAVSSMLCILRLFFLGAVSGKDALADAVVPFGVEEAAAEGDASAADSSSQSYAAATAGKTGLTREEAAIASQDPGTMSVVNNPDGTFTVIDHVMEAEEAIGSSADDAYLMMGLDDERPSKRPTAGGRRMPNALKKRRAAAAASASSAGDPLGSVGVAQAFIAEFGGDLSPAIVAALPATGTVPRLLDALADASARGGAADSEIVRFGLDLLLMLCVREISVLQSLLAPSSGDALMPAGADLRTLLLSLLLCAESRSIRLHTSRGLYRLCQHITEGVSPLPRAYMQDILLEFLDDVAQASQDDASSSKGPLASLLRKDKSGVVPCQQYFALLNNLVRDSTSSAAPAPAEGKEGEAAEAVAPALTPEELESATLRLRPVMISLVQRVCSHQGLEKRAGSGTAAGAVSHASVGSKITDTILIGLLSLLTTLAETVPAFRMEMACSGPDGKPVSDAEAAGGAKDFLNCLFVDCLFYEPQSLEDLDETDCAKLPKCKRSATRKAAFKLLSALCEDTPSVVVRLLSVLKPVLEGVTRVNKYRYKADNDARSSTGYLGIFNLTCLCYMICMLQQLFMIPRFRYGVLAADANVRPGKAITDDESEEDSDDSKSGEGEAKDEEEDDPRETTDESMLWQLQRMFGFLTLSLRRFYDPTPWIKAFKMFGQPIDIKVQQDTEEFLNSLLDQLSERLAGGSEGSLVHDIVTGQTTEQFVDTRNGNILKERTEPFHHLSLMVKNVPGVSQSLELLTAGENIDDYHLEDEDVRITINKRTRITCLPAVLFLHCKRFDFSFETFMMEKLNGRFEFEDELDMFPYTREGALAATAEEGAAEQEEEEEDEDKPKVLPREHYKYRLQGIVIHMGGAQGGHYWSYIRDRATGQWNEFNDSRTSKFDSSNIEGKAFGGPQAGGAGGGGNAYSSGYDNSANAYMLVYEKVVPSQGISDAVALAAATAGTQYTASDAIADPPGYSPLGGELSAKPLSEEQLAVLNGDMPEEEEAAKEFKATMEHAQARTAFTGAKQFDERLRTLAAAVRGEVDGEEVSRQTVVEKLLPKDILADVFSDNVRFLRDQDVYSDEFFSFMKDLLARAGGTVVKEGNHSAACNLVRIGMDYALNILSKAENNKTFAELGTVMKDVVSGSAPAAAMLLDEYLASPKDLVQGLLSCPTDDVRNSLAGIVNCALSTVYAEEMQGTTGHAHLFEDVDFEKDALSQAEYSRIVGPEDDPIDDTKWTAPWMTMRLRKSRCCRFLALLLDNLEVAYSNWPRFEQLFAILSHAASLGAGMRRVLVAAGVIETLVDLLMEKESPELLQAYVRPPEAKRDGIGNPRASPKWGALLECVSLLVRGTTMPRFVREGAGAHKTIIKQLRAALPEAEAARVWTSTPPTVLDAESAFSVPVDPITGDSVDMTAEDLKAGKLFEAGFGLGLLQLPKFFESALKGASGGGAVSSMLRHMVWENPDFSGTVCSTVASNLNMALEGAVDSYWDVIDGLAGLRDSLQLRRITILLGDPHHMRSHMAGTGFGLPTLPVPPPKKADGASNEASDMQMERVNRMLAMSGISGGALMATYRRRYSSPKYVEGCIERLLKLMHNNPLVLLYVWRLPALTRNKPTEARLAGPAWSHDATMVVPNSRSKLAEGEEAPRRDVTILPDVQDREEYLVSKLHEAHPPLAFDRFADWMLPWLVHRCEFTLCSRSFNKETLKRLQGDVRTAVAAREAGDALVTAVAAQAGGNAADAAALCAKPADGALSYGTVVGMPTAPEELPEDEVSKADAGTAWRVAATTVPALARMAGGHQPAQRSMGLPKPTREDLVDIFRRQSGRVVSDSHALGVYCCAHEYTAEDGELHLVFRTVSENRQPLDFELTIVSRDEEQSNFPVPQKGEKYMYRLHPRDVVFFHECKKVDTASNVWGGFRFNWVYNYVEDAEGKRVNERDSELDTDEEGRLGLNKGGGRAAPGATAEPNEHGKRRRVQPESDLVVDVDDSDDDSTGVNDGHVSPSDVSAGLYRSDSDYARALARMEQQDGFEDVDDLGMMADDGTNQINFDTEDDETYGPQLP